MCASNNYDRYCDITLGAYVMCSVSVSTTDRSRTVIGLKTISKIHCITSAVLLRSPQSCFFEPDPALRNVPNVYVIAGVGASDMARWAL